ncbi:hypothetical protein [Cohnella terricola]|uniref:DUF11 domain-containing protein n=1 Tax=Cohnella terricola TaxID=1289167 RepID=A0A559JGR9_9BACL|nr:hypothetical protein [Cohnella terricola]TVX99072.1 hypothetical protein FPZ45_14055 [Cohnella terricola]
MMFDNIDGIQLVIAAIGLLALIISFLVYRQTKNQNKRFLSVELTNGFIVYENNSLSDDVYFFITVRNASSKNIVVNSFNLLNIRVRGKKYALIPPQSNIVFPHRLQEGDNCQVWISREDFLRTVERDGFTKSSLKIRAQVMDGTGNRYHSNIFKIRMN